MIALALNSKRKKKDESNTDIMRHRWKLERELAAAQRAKAMGALSGPYSSSSAYQGQVCCAAAAGAGCHVGGGGPRNPFHPGE